MSRSKLNVLLSTLGAAALMTSLATVGASAKPARAIHATHAAAASHSTGQSFDANGFPLGAQWQDPNSIVSRIQVPTMNGLQWETIETPAYTDD